MKKTFLFLGLIFLFISCDKDKSRTTAVEGIVIDKGNKQPIDSVKVTLRDGVGTGGDPIFPGNTSSGKKNRWGNGAWIKGLVYSAPAYIGIRQGNSVTRFGYSSRWVQDKTQNFIHRNFYPGRQHLYNDYSQMYEGWYNYTGYYNSLTLY